MDRLISEQAVIDSIEFFQMNPQHFDFVNLIDDIKEIPSAEPKTGHWIEENINEWSCKVFCSECGCPSPFEHISNGDVYSALSYGVINKTKYCPNCGVKMVMAESEDKNET